MKTKGTVQNKVNIITLGCSKNIVDSEEILTQLQANGINAAHEEQDDSSRIVIINTCGFVENAKQESIDTILLYADAKANNKIDKLFVTGCLSERYKSDLERDIPLVDAYFGTRDLPRLLKQFKADYKHELVGERLLSTPAHYAYLKIAEGCDRPCSFCAIPIMRGKHQSRPEEEILKLAKNLAKNGTKELILIAQDLTYYGLDIYKKRALAQLIEKLSDVEGIEWIRLQYAYPAGFPMDVLDVMKAKSNVCKYLDMPLQHISDEMLKLMRRGLTQEKTEKLIFDIREKIPEIAIRTTLIVGHPGETPQEFDKLYDFVERAKFDRLGVFEYSDEDQTHSFDIEPKVKKATMAKRKEKLMELQSGISLEHNLKKIGQTVKVLIDRKESGYFVGRTEYDSPEVDNEVLIPAENTYLRNGDFVHVVIDNAQEFDLFGKVV